jgi:transposase
MRNNTDWAPGPGVRIVGVERDGDRWVISAVGPGIGSCPDCGQPSTRRHSRYVRHLQDLPAQGSAVMVSNGQTEDEAAPHECSSECHVPFNYENEFTQFQLLTSAISLIMGF